MEGDGQVFSFTCLYGFQFCKEYFKILRTLSSGSSLYNVRGSYYK